MNAAARERRLCGTQRIIAVVVVMVAGVVVARGSQSLEERDRAVCAVVWTQRGESAATWS